jgi:hypothetical protein
MFSTQGFLEAEIGVDESYYPNFGLPKGMD